MEFKVVASKLRSKLITALLPSMIAQLGLTNSKKCLVVFVEKSDSALGATVNLDALGAYVITIKPGTLNEIMLTLAHEMVHVRQLAKGLLRPAGNGVNYWCGKRYGKKTKYLDMPWEIDAFSRQEILMRRALEA